MERRNINASSNSVEPSKSPKAVKYGIAELSGSILNLHMVCVRRWAVYNSNISCITPTVRYEKTKAADTVDVP